MRGKLGIRFLDILLLGMATATSSFSQAVNATLLGTVTDLSGGVVANAKVTIAETNTGISHSRQTNESGNYTFPELPPGLYTVSAEMEGLQERSSCRTFPAAGPGGRNGGDLYT
jgi:Carboxypeptidase regulatory-like domain